MVKNTEKTIKKHKNMKKAVITSLSFLVYFYLMVSGYQLSFDISIWEKEIRGFFIFFGGIIAGLLFITQLIAQKK